VLEVYHCGEGDSPPSPDCFRKRYLERGEPILLMGFASSWPACREWVPDMFRRRFGDRQVEVMAGRENDPDYEIRCLEHKRKITMREYVDWMEAPGAGNDGYLVANNQLFRDPAFLALLADCSPVPSYLDPALMDADHCFLWLGPEGTVTPLHHDTSDVLFVQIHGSKLFRFWPKDQQPFLYNHVGVFSEVDPESPDLDRHPLYAQAGGITFPVMKGDALLIPQGMWHHVRSTSSSVSISFTGFSRS
jgi:hypothetical protein